MEGEEMPHMVHVLMPASEFRATENTLDVQVNCDMDTLEDIAYRVRQQVYVPPSHRPLWVSPLTGKPHLDGTEAIVNQGIRNNDTLKLFFFHPGWQG
jgi:hypothetical protein